MEDKFGISKEFNRENQSIQHTYERRIEKSSDRNELDLSSHLEQASKIREQYGRDLQRSEQQDEKVFKNFRNRYLKILVWLTVGLAIVPVIAGSVGIRATTTQPCS